MAIDQRKLTAWFARRVQPGDPNYQLAEPIRIAAMGLAEVIVSNTPACADQSDAVRKTRESWLMSEEAIRVG